MRPKHIKPLVNHKTFFFLRALVRGKLNTDIWKAEKTGSGGQLFPNCSSNSKESIYFHKANVSFSDVHSSCPPRRRPNSSMCDFLMEPILETVTCLPWPTARQVATLGRMWSGKLTQPFAGPSLVFGVLSFPLLLQEWRASYLFETQLLVDEEEQNSQKDNEDPNCRQEANGLRWDWQENTKRKTLSQLKWPDVSSNTWSNVFRIFRFINESGKYSTGPDWMAPPGLSTGEGKRALGRDILLGWFLIPLHMWFLLPGTQLFSLLFSA